MNSAAFFYTYSKILRSKIGLLHGVHSYKVGMMGPEIGDQMMLERKGI